MTRLDADRLLALLGPSSLNRGKAAGIRSHFGSGARAVSTAQREFLDAIASRSRERVAVPLHPEAEATKAQYRRNKDEDLTAVELAWLQRLPLDPEQVSFEDAAQLAALSASVNSMKTPASARLVASVWEPVKALHDARVAEAQLAKVKQPLPPLPPSTVGAVRDAISDDYPNATPEMVEIEARRIVDRFEEERRTSHERELEKAGRKVSELQDGARRRSETSREVVR